MSGDLPRHDDVPAIDDDVPVAGVPAAVDVPAVDDAVVDDAAVDDAVVDDDDLAAVEAQLGRPPRGVRRVAHRCACGRPDVVATEPRLPDGTPFPTLYYLTCPKATAAVGRLEAAGLMREMQERLEVDAELRAHYARAHAAYLRDRTAVAAVDEIAGISAGGMPDRVKCLHVLAAHALAAGPGANPLGDETLERIGPWWAAGSCLPEPRSRPDGPTAIDPARLAAPDRPPVETHLAGSPPAAAPHPAGPRPPDAETPPAGHPAAPPAAATPTPAAPPAAATPTPAAPPAAATPPLADPPGAAPSTPEEGR